MTRNHHGLTDSRVFRAINTNHPELAHLASPPEVEQSQTHNSDLLVRPGSPTTDKAGGVLASPDLIIPIVRRDQTSPELPLGLEHTINTLRGCMVAVDPGLSLRRGCCRGVQESRVEMETGGGKAAQLLQGRGASGSEPQARLPIHRENQTELHNRHCCLAWPGGRIQDEG